MATDPRIDRYLAKDRPWVEEIRAFRAICLAEGLTETLKWRQPCYSAHGGNVAIIGAEKADCVLSFFKGALLEDPVGLLVFPGPNSRSAKVFRATSVAQIVAAEGALLGFLRAAVENERLGQKPDMPPDDLELPAELVDALNSDGALRAAWEALTPGRRRGWVITFAQPKKPETRLGRIAKAREKILAGKGIHDR